MLPDLDVKLLIHAVCHRPALWDRTLDVYKDRSEAVKCWDEVCLLLNEDFITLSDARQDKFRRDVIAKWKILRNSFRLTDDRMRRDRKSGVPESRIKKSIFYKELEFLRKIFINCRSKISSQESADGCNKPSGETMEGPHRDDLIEGPEEVDIDELDETDATFHIIIDNRNDPRSCTLRSSTKTTTATPNSTSLNNTSNESEEYKKKRPRETQKSVEFEAKTVENTSFNETTTSQDTEEYKVKRPRETHKPVEIEAKTVENSTPTTFHDTTSPTSHENEACTTRRPSETCKPVEFEAKTVENTSFHETTRPISNETQAYKTKRPSETCKSVEFEAKTVENTSFHGTTRPISNETQAYKTKRPSETYKPVEFEAKSPKKVQIQNRHMAFMQGLLPTLNSFTDDEVLDFQAGALALIQNIKRARRIRY
ncbi:uncharacterized protein LOC111050686 [Nilaparvata lugens]|uniref:uncharacterized protein LOC111050686 n=1 Tax=Nilaparvata lugens TaxID=108931 RepID=UPI00193D4776|nr:uncharacterized protein LOC111050686 [Nilaparvata lugens]